MCELSRHDVNQVAKSVVRGTKDLPAHLIRIRNEADFQAQPLLRAVGIQRREKIRKQNVVRDKKVVERILESVRKLLIHRIEKEHH